MEPGVEEGAREHLRSSTAVFIAALMAFVGGVLLVWQTLALIENAGSSGSSGVPPSLLAVWVLLFIEFAAALWLTAVLSRARRAPLRREG